MLCRACRRRRSTRRSISYSTRSRRRGKLQSQVDRAAVDQQILADDEARVRAAEERAGAAELVRCTEASRGHLGHARPGEAVVVLSGLRRALAQTVDLSGGGKGP